MRNLFLLIALMGSGATAQLLGTSGSLMQTNLCRQFDCYPQGYELLGGNIRMEYYRIGPSSGPVQGNWLEAPGTVTLTRFNGVIVSGRFSGIGQDYPFDTEREVIYSGFVRELSGTALSRQNLFSIFDNCNYAESQEAPKIIPMNVGGRRYGVSCYSRAVQNARDYAITVFRY